MVMTNGDPTGHIKDYSKALRAIGDGLEALQAELIEIKCAGDNYIVCAKTRSQLSKISLLNDLRNGAFRIMWQILPSRYRWEEPSAMELSYTPKVVEQLESAGQARREKAGMPDPYSIPTALRVIGEYIDSKDVRLRHIARRDEMTIIQYETSQGEYHTEELTASALYALFVQMFAKRNGRSPENGEEIEAPQTDPGMALHKARL
jgi:hypothetical protein